MKGKNMSPELINLIEKDRKFKPSDAELEAYFIDSAYGNEHFENPRITREMIETQASLDKDRIKTNALKTSA